MNCKRRRPFITFVFVPLQTTDFLLLAAAKPCALGGGGGGRLKGPAGFDSGFGGETPETTLGIIFFPGGFSPFFSFFSTRVVRWQEKNSKCACTKKKHSLILILIFSSGLLLFFAVLCCNTDRSEGYGRRSISSCHGENNPAEFLPTIIHGGSIRRFLFGNRFIPWRTSKGNS